MHISQLLVRHVTNSSEERQKGGIPVSGRYCYLFFSGYCSVTEASQLLAHNMISNRIVRAPAGLGGGCSFAVLVNAPVEGRSIELLGRSGINVERSVRRNTAIFGGV